MKFLRQFFGLQNSSKRTVLGGSGVSLEISQVSYVQESNESLHALHELYKRFKGSQHEEKVKKVWEKTREIHQYLLNRGRVHDLTLFHIQHTEHFINAFTAILDLHQKSQPAAPAYNNPGLKPRPVSMFEKFRAEKQKRRENNTQGPEMVIPLSRLKSALHMEDLKAEASMLQVPEISINTYTKIPYRMPDPETGRIYEIGFTSTPQDKENFLLYVSAQLGIQDITYVGNTLVSIPNSNGSNPTGVVPVIHWEGFMYVLNLNDFRLFPVKTYRKKL